MQALLESLKKGLIVSCQASPGWPFFGSENMGRMALAAQMGGAAGIRACGPDNVRAIKLAVSIPVIGINKVFEGVPTAADVIITPSFESAAQVIEAGSDILGLDCTARGRSWDDVGRLLEEIRKHYPKVPILADISTPEEGLMAARLGADILSTTLSGYTNTSLGLTEEEARSLTGYQSGQEPPPDISLIKMLREQTNLLINAEGRFWEAEQVQEAFRAGADMITIGTAITAPQLITKRFAKAILDV